MKSNKYKNMKIRLHNGSEITLKQEIGQGSFSNVYSTSNNHYVAKVMNLNYLPSQESYENEKKYYELLKPNQNIVSFLSSQEINDGQSQQLGVLVIENCPKGSLVEIMAQTPKFQLSEQQILRVIYEVAQGLSYIHEKKFIHRDIKIENILYSEDNHFKICDFGSMTDNIIDRISKHNKVEIKEEIDKNTTPMYRSPEMLEPDLFPEFPINQKSDIFALGVMAYILCYKKAPFETSLGAINGSCPWPEFPVVSDGFHDLMVKMISISPFDRPSAKDIIKIILNELQFDLSNDGLIDPFIFSKQSQKEIKASWYQTINAKFFGVFFDTKGWIKGALQYDELGPKQKYVRKLLLKAWKKRPKTDKFYSLLYNHWKENRNNTIINMKILILLHHYLKKGPPEAIKNPSDRKITPEKILEEIQQNWQSIIQKKEIAQSKDPKRSQYTSTLIVNFSIFLLQKIKLNQKYSQYFEGNFSLNPYLESAKKKFKHIDPLILPSLIEFLAFTLKFVNINLLHQCQLWNIQATIALSMLDEIYCLLCLVLHLYKTFKISTNFESKKFKNDEIKEFIQKQDINIEKFYKQSQLYFLRCSLITETVLPVQKLIPKLPDKVVEYIQSLEILTNNIEQFSIFDHLNYKQSIYGLVLPQSYVSGVIESMAFDKDDNMIYTQINNPVSFSSNQFKQSTKQDKQSNQLKPPQQEVRAHSANSMNKQKQSYDSDGDSDENIFQGQQKDDYIFKKPSSSASNMPEYINGKPYIPNPNLVKKDSKYQNQANKNNQQAVESNNFNLWQQTQNNHNPEVQNAFDNFNNNNENLWDPSHHNLVNGNGQVQEKYDSKPIDLTKGGGSYFPEDDLERTVRTDKEMNDLDEIMFGQQIPPYLNQQANNNPFGDQNSSRINQIKSNVNNGNNINQNNGNYMFDNFGMGNNNHNNNNNQFIQQKHEIDLFDPEYMHNVPNQMNQINNQQQMFQQQYQQQQYQQQIPYQNQYQQQGYQHNLYQQQQMGYNLQMNGNQMNYQYQQQSNQNNNQLQNQFFNQQQFQHQQQQQFNTPFQSQQQQQQFLSQEQKNQSPDQQILQLKTESDKSEGMATILDSINQKKNQQLIGVEESEEEQKNSKKKRNKTIQRLGSENISDDDAAAKPPLDSFLSNQKSLIDPNSQMRRSLSPFPNSTDIESNRTKDTPNLINSQVINQEKQQQCKLKIQKHPQLVKYIVNEVNSEFFDFIVDFSEFTIGKKIGSGNSCEVFKGTCKNKEVAIKVIKLDNSDEVHLKEFQREIQALIKIKNHENLLQLVGISSNDNNFYIVTEFCKGSTLFDLLHKKKKEITIIKWDHRIRWLKDIAKGMSYLHSQNLIHRDLKSLNLLFDNPYDPKSNQVPIMKIADFGLTRVGSSVAVQLQSGALGTFHWMSPETIRNQPVSTKSDVYSFAIVLWELAARKTPYTEFKNNLGAIINHVQSNGRPKLEDLPQDTPPYIKQLMVLCWDDDPTKRPKFDEILQILEKPSILTG